MPRRPKRARELTDDQVLRKLFPTEARKEAKEKAQKALEKGEKPK